MNSRVKVALVALATLTVLRVISWAGDQPLHRVTLAGVGPVNLVVEQLSNFLKTDGLSASNLRTDTELRLRSAGIPVATESESLISPGFPYLYVRVTGADVVTLAGRQFGYSAFVEVSFVQVVQLERDTSIRVHAPTWSIGELVTGQSTEVVRKSLRDLVDRFANAYLSANPK